MSEFKDNAFSNNCERDTDILKLLSIKNIKENIIPENEEELVNNLLKNWINNLLKVKHIII